MVEEVLEAPGFAISTAGSYSDVPDMRAGQRQSEHPILLTDIVELLAGGDSKEQPTYKLACSEGFR